MLLLMGACAGTPQATSVPTIPPVPSGSTPTRAGQSAAALPTATPEALAALINGKIKITQAALDNVVNRQLEARKAAKDPMPADMTAFRETALNALIDQAIIEEAAAVQGITVTDQDVNTEIADYVKAAGSRDKWLAQITADKMTENEYRAGVRSALLTNKMRDIVTRNIGTTAEQVHARHILVADQSTAAQLLAQLKSGADFNKLAAQSSLDLITKQNGGDLGWFPRGQLLQKSVEDAAFALAINEYSSPIQSDLGYHIIQTLEKVKDRPVSAYTRAKLTEEAFEQWLQALVKKATIVKYPRS
jgi:parvulin-like peptidyl-prolyl isomerase